MTACIRPLLVFPPGWTPFAPYLALPALKGYLESRDIPTEIADYNVEFFDYIFTPEFLSAALQKAEAIFSDLDARDAIPSAHHALYRKTVKALLSRNVIRDVSWAKSTIRSQAFYHPDQGNKAKRILCDALDLASCAYEDMKIEFNHISLKYKSTSTQQILAALCDETANPYLTFYRSQLIPHIQSSDHNLLGISITSGSQLIPAMTLASLVRQECPNIRHIVLGGNLITRLATHWEQRHPFFDYIDYIITYEGEQALYQLIRVLEEGSDISNVPNLIYVVADQLLKTRVEGIDAKALALPNFDGYITGKYFMPDLVLPLYSSKSCFAKCTFCTIPFATPGKYRVLEIDTIYAFMAVLSKKYQTKYFTFVDETFAPPIMHKLAQKLIQEQAEFYWYGETRFTAGFTEALCQTLYAGGCRKIQFGLESYDQRILDLMQKNVKVEWIEPAAENCLKAGIALHFFFMVGFPTETYEEALKTVRFTRKMQDLSRYTYKNHHTTRGWGPFGLDKYSGVWMSPDTYGIVIAPPAPEHDLVLHNIEYEATRGMTQAEARHLVNQYRNAYGILDATDHQPFHDLMSKFSSEEEPFLTLSRGESHCNSSDRRLYCELPSAPERPLVLPPQVTSVRLRHHILKKSLPPEPLLLLYHPELHNICAFEGDDIPLMMKTIEHQSVCQASIMPRRIIQALAMNGFIEGGEYHRSRRQRALDKQKFMLHPQAIAVAHPNAHQHSLYLYSTGKVLHTSSQAFSMLQKFCDGASLRDVLWEVNGRADGQLQRELQKLVASCAMSGFLVACDFGEAVKAACLRKEVNYATDNRSAI